MTSEPEYQRCSGAGPQLQAASGNLTGCVETTKSSTRRLHDVNPCREGKDRPRPSGARWDRRAAWLQFPIVAWKRAFRPLLALVLARCAGRRAVLISTKAACMAAP